MQVNQCKQLLRTLFLGKAVVPGDMIRSAKASLGALPIIANTLVEAVGHSVRVVHGFNGLGATDGNTIQLMDLPIPKDDVDIDTFVLMLGLSYGLIHHEVGHVNESDFDAIKATAGDPLLNHLLGIIEDVRMENAHIRRWPNARQFLDGLCTAMVVTGHNGAVKADCKPIHAFTTYLMYCAYRDFRQDGSVDDFVDDARAAVEKQFPAGVLIRLDAMMPRLGKLKDSWDALSLANDIRALLQDELDKANQQQAGQTNGNASPGQGTGSDGNASGASPAQGDSTPGTGDGTSSGDPAASGGAGGNQGNQPQAGASGGTDSSAASAEGGGSGASSGQDLAQQIANLQAVLSGDDADTAKGDRSQVAAQILQALVADVTNHGSVGTVSMTSPAVVGDLKLAEGDVPVKSPPYDMDAALSATARLRQKLLKEMQARTSSDVHVGKRGRRLSGSHLHRVAVGDARIMRRVDEDVDLDTSVVLLGDISGSMALPRSIPKIMVASQALYATAVAMDGLDGVEVAVATFPAFAVILPFGTKPRRRTDRFSIASQGTTPMAEGIYLAQRMLGQRTTSRKLMVVITDGEPDCEASAQLSMLSAGAAGIEVYGLGIDTDAGASLFDRWQSIATVNELPETLIGLLRARLLRAA